MGPGEVRQVLAMEAQAERHYRQLREARRRLNDPALTDAAERQAIEQEALKLERELERLDRLIDERRKALGNPIW